MISLRDFDRTSVLPTAVYGRTSGHLKTPSMIVLKSWSTFLAYGLYFPLHDTSTLSLIMF